MALLDFAGGAEAAGAGADAACSTGDGQGAGWELEVGRLLQKNIPELRKVGWCCLVVKGGKLL